MRASGFRRVFGWLRRDGARAVDEELRSHIDMKTDDLMRDGLDEAEARRVARARFGDLDRIRGEALRVQAQAQRRWRRAEIFDDTARDFRFAARGLVRDPAFSVIAVVTLALGIGANTAMFGAVNGLLLRTLPGIDRPDRLVEVSQGTGDDFISISYPIFDHIRRHAESLEDVAAFDVVSMSIGGVAPPEVVFGLQVTGNYFDVLGVRPAAGRFFDRRRSFPPTVEDAVVISHALWQRRFGGAEGVVGRTVVLNGYPARLIGVAPQGFGGHIVAAKADVFVPLGMPAPEVHAGDRLDVARNGMLETVGRMVGGATVPAVGAEVAALAEGFIRELEGPDAIYPLRTVAYSPVPGNARFGARVLFAILTAIVGLLLAITCVNVANMLLSRSGARAREIAVRLSLGATRGRLLRLLMTESVLVAASAAVLGTLLAVWLARLMARLHPPVLPFPGMRLELDLGIDGRVLVFSIALTALAAVAFGLLPALRATRPALTQVLREDSGGGRAGSRLRAAMVAGQTAFTVLLLLGAGLFFRALQTAQAVETGFEVERVHVAGFDVGLNGYGGNAAPRLYDELLRRFEGFAGVEAVAIAGKLPLAGASSATITAPGSGVGAVGGAQPEVFSLHNQSVSRDYFRTLDLALVRGRTFGPGDTDEAPMVAVINETMARRFWSIDTAVGERFEMHERPVEVVGVVVDAKYHRLVEETPLFAYFSHLQRPRNDMYLHIKAAESADSEQVWAFVRDAVAAIDPAVPLLSAAPLDEALRVFLLPQLLAAWVTGVAGALGLALGAVGIYGVTAYAASRRFHEIGVRMALGARGADVRGMMMWQGMRAPLVGVAIGVSVAVGLTRFLQGFLVGISPLDPLTFVGVPAALLLVALLATLPPARRASTLDPMRTLKS